MYYVKRMQKLYYEGAPDIVKQKVAFIAGPFDNVVCPYEILLVEMPHYDEVVGIDFDKEGWKGTHFFLTSYQAANYRRRVGKKKVKWIDLPTKTQEAILNYLKEE